MAPKPDALTPRTRLAASPAAGTAALVLNWYWWHTIDTRQPIPMSEIGAASAVVAYLEARHGAERHIDLMG